MRTRGARSRAVLASALIGAISISAALPAAAGKGNGPKSDPSGPITCAELGDHVDGAAIRSAIGIGAGSAWEGSLTGEGVDIAVIDTGITQLGRFQDVVDGPDLSLDAETEGLRHEDLMGHGTAMASLIADQEHGIAPDARLIDIKVGAGDGTVDVSQVIAGVDWAVDNRTANGFDIDVLYLAYDGDVRTKEELDAGVPGPDHRTDPLAHAVERAWHAGIVVVVAGGNDGRGHVGLGNPAIDPYVIAVGAAKQTTEEIRGKNKGPAPVTWKVSSKTSLGDGVRNPDVVAPGQDVITPAIPGSYLHETFPLARCVSDGTEFLRGTGTSQGAAVAAGAVALLLEQRPDLTPGQVKELLARTATPLIDDGADGMPPFPPEVQGHGMIDLGTALATPAASATAADQDHPVALGTASLESSRLGLHLETDTGPLAGEVTAFGSTWDSTAHAALPIRWTDQTWSGATWSGGTWSGATWSGATWSGATWSGATWSGATWSGATWSGATWSGATWSGATWSGATWSGATWSGATWSGATWSGATWSGATWSSATWS